MKKKKWISLFAYALLISLLPPLSGGNTANPSDVIAGMAKIMAIDKKDWIVKAIGREESVIASGKYILVIKIHAPDKSQGIDRRLGVYDDGELTIKQRRLQVGDVIQFRAMRAVFDGQILPDVFANLKDVVVVSGNNEEKPNADTRK